MKYTLTHLNYYLSVAKKYQYLALSTVYAQPS